MWRLPLCLFLAPGPLGPRAKGTGRRGWGPVALGLGLLCVGLLAGLLILGVRREFGLMNKHQGLNH